MGGLQYLVDGDWQFNWATDKSVKNTCRKMTLKLKGGQKFTADFGFRA